MLLFDQHQYWIYRGIVGVEWNDNKVENPLLMQRILKLAIFQYLTSPDRNSPIKLQYYFRLRCQ